VLVGLDPSGSGLQLASQNLPVTIKFGRLTLTQIEMQVVDLGVSFSEDLQVKLSISVAISIKTGSIRLVGDFAGEISDRKDSDEEDGDDDEYAIVGTFITDAVLDPNQNFAKSAGDPGQFDFQIDTIDVTIGRLLKVTAIDSVFTPTAEGQEAMVGISDAAVLLKVGALAVGGKINNFGFLADGKPYTGKDFSVTVSLGQNDQSPLQLPEWLPLKNLEVTLFWQGDNFKNKPDDFRIIIDAEVEGIKGFPLLEVDGSVRGLTIDVGLLVEGRFPIVGIDAVSVSIEGDTWLAIRCAVAS
jgi:hypothetical protein